MPFEAAIPYLFHAIDIGSDDSPWLRFATLEALPEAVRRTPIRQKPSKANPLVEACEYLTYVLQVLAKLASIVVEAQNLEDFAEKAIREMEEEDDFTDLNVFDEMIEQHAALRKLVANIQKADEQCRAVWLGAPAPVASQIPPENISTPLSPPAPDQNFMSSVPRVSISTVPELEQDPTSANLQPECDLISESHLLRELPQPKNQNEQSESPYLSALLNKRGKGQWKCNFGTACKKGGVDEDGQLIIFERNSYFKKHMQKHERLFKCELPGCSNKKGFARPDQLSRHEKNIHNISEQLVQLV